MSGKRRWYAFTPAGSMVATTEASTREQCIRNLLREAAHMPYGTWQNFKQRGYTVECVQQIATRES